MGPVSNGSQHAVEISRMSLDLLAKIVTFEIKHKPGFRLKLRMGMHSGKVVGGVVGSKIPHYSVFGDTVEIAGLMESTGLPMKIQMSQEQRIFLRGLVGSRMSQGGWYSFLRLEQCPLSGWSEGKTRWHQSATLPKSNERGR